MTELFVFQRPRPHVLVIILVIIIIIYLAVLNKNGQGAAKVQMLWSVDLLPQYHGAGKHNTIHKGYQPQWYCP